VLEAPSGARGTGRWKFTGEYPNTGDEMDWALVLEDAARNLPVAEPE
jgi:hypothetical protein